MKIIIRTNHLATIIILLAIAFSQISCGKAKKEELTIMEGHFKQCFTETGELVAIKAVAVPMPPVNYRYGYEFKIVEMVDNGSMVHQGDTIVKLDPSTIEKFIISQNESLENELAAAKKQEVEIRNGLQELEAKLKTELASYNMKKLEMEKGQFESDNKKKIKELQFKQAGIKLDRVKRQLEMKPILNNYDKRIQQIKVMQKEADLDGAQEAIDRMAVTCPEDGLFQVAQSMFHYPRQDLKVGDAVFRDALIARIPDITRMKVKTIVSEIDFTKISVGTKVIVRMDALPSVPFTGVVSEISRVCLPKDEEKVFNVQVVIDESDLRLKPGMTVSCEYICWEADDVLYAPNKCVLKEEGRAYIFLDNGTKPKKLEVQIGVSNSNHTMLHGDLKPGQKILSFESILNQKST